MDKLTYLSRPESNPSHSEPRSAPGRVEPGDKAGFGFSARLTGAIVAGQANEVAA